MATKRAVTVWSALWTAIRRSIDGASWYPWTVLLLLACVDAPPLEPDLDVVVIGAGASGLVAARQAQEAGASTVVLEMADSAGGGAGYAGRFLAVGTPQQSSVGVTDTVEIALSEWPDFTNEEPDAVVQAFIEDSAGILGDFEDRYGAEFIPPVPAQDAGDTPRVHALSEPFVEDLVAGIEDLRTGVRVERLLEGDDGVCGVVATELSTGDSFELTASAVIVATGMFNLNQRGADWSHLWSGLIWQGPQGRALAIKLGLAAAVLAVSLVHDWFIGPKATERLLADPTSTDAQKLRKVASWVGRANVLLGLAIVAMAALFVRGGI